MVTVRGAWVLVAAIAVAAPCLAQDSLSKTACLPGDAVRPWDDASATFGSEQCNNYVVDLTPFTTSWGTTFGIAPIIKSSKTSSTFLSSVVSAQGISRLQQQNATPASVYYEWTDRGFGVNNDPSINDPGTPVSPTEIPVNQFGVAFAEFGTTDNEASYNGVIGAIGHISPGEPSRLYMQRIVAATNSCDDDSELAQLGFGSVDESGYVHFRADNFFQGMTPGGCSPLTLLSGNNVFQVNMSARDCDALNVLSNDYVGGGQFDVPATKWLVRNDTSTVHTTPAIVPASVMGGLPLFMESSFAGDYVRGTAFPPTADQTHIAGTAIQETRANIAYLSQSHPVVGSSEKGIAAMFGQKLSDLGTACSSSSGYCTDTIILWGLDGAGNVTANFPLTLPWWDGVGYTTITDNDDGFTNLLTVSFPPQFHAYQSQVPFRGGNGQVAMNVDAEGRLLVAATAAHPTNPGTNDWDINYIPVARITCPTPPTPCTTPTVEWTMAAYNTSDEAGGSLSGKAIKDGPGGTQIGFLRPFTGDANLSAGDHGGPAISAPAMDSAGNVWFVSAYELLDDPGNLEVGLFRSVYDPVAFKYELELVLTADEVFHGQNSNRDYRVDFIPLASADSISSNALVSQNISEQAHVGLNPAVPFAPADPRTLGGLVFTADIIYDGDDNDMFLGCTFEPKSEDQEYNAILYIGALFGPDCTDATECNDGNICTVDSCNPETGTCENPLRIYGDINGDGVLSLFDIFCMLDLIGGVPETGTCTKANADIEPCPDGNGVVSLLDVFSVLDVIGGTLDDPDCCVPPLGACCRGGGCDNDVTEAECVATDGLYQGDGSTCGGVTCPNSGACCTLGQCTILSQVQCSQRGGDYEGDGTACSPNPCPPIGACCLQGICQDNLTGSECLLAGGLFQGPNTTCDTATCPTGACCAAGHCAEGTKEALCVAGGGTYQGNGSSCTPGLCGAPVEGLQLNEVRKDQDGADDDEYFEVAGTAATPLAGVGLVVIGDGVGLSGTIEEFVPLTGAVTGTGFYVVAESTFSIGTADQIEDLNFENSDNVTYLLVAGFYGELGDDLDSDDDCVLDSTPWAHEFNRVAIVEIPNPPTGTFGPFDECSYGPPSVGPEPPDDLAPGHVYLCPNIANTWAIGDFVAGVDDTPGAANPTCP
jgi:hypothetical protein